MIVELHNNLKDPQKIKASRLVIYDDFNNPIAIFMTYGNGHIHARLAGEEEEFENSLKFFGIDKTDVKIIKSKK